MKTKLNIFHAFSLFSRKDWLLWILSLCVVIAANVLAGDIDILTLIAVCLGVTSLILAAKGSVWAQILIIFFSILYGIISWRFRYWGEMITYLGMTLPMAVWSAVTWLKNPADNGLEVEIRKLKKRDILWLSVSAAIVTVVFYFILRSFDTPNMFFSTLSITTSFLAASLTMLRSSYFALFYAANDLVLIVLWSMAMMEDPVYMPVTVNFAIFLINDMYGFINWKRRENKK